MQRAPEDAAGVASLKGGASSGPGLYRRRSPGHPRKKASYKGREHEAIRLTASQGRGCDTPEPERAQDSCAAVPTRQVRERRSHEP